MILNDFILIFFFKFLYFDQQYVRIKNKFTTNSALNSVAYATQPCHLSH